MIETYVENVMKIVEDKCSLGDINEGSFWDWLGNDKFKEDNGNLTPERARQIGQDIGKLIEEYKNGRT